MPSKHANAGLLVRRGLYDDLHSFAELEQRISALGDENTKIVGDALEVFVEAYLATQQKMQAETVWLVGQVPLDIRLKLNLPNDAKGIDGIFGTRTGTLVPYQVKFRSQRAYLTYTEIAPFLGLTERATDRIVFTNSNELAQDVKNRDAMRTVRGIDFDDLTENDFKAISAWLREQPVAIPKLTPSDRPYQIEALTRISETLAKSDRAHVVMACGTGKTLVALWAVEALKPKTVLVLVPSLMLLQQTLDEWSRHNSWGHDFTYLCVCSDPTVTYKDEYDPIRLDAMDLDFRVDTDPDEVRRFIEADTTKIKIVFSTYHSSPVVSAGVRGLAPFDIAIFDEAHKTTGQKGDLFAHCLSEANINIQKRLFFTATPLHYDIQHRNREGDFEIQSMDDPAVYGPRAYTLNFGQASGKGIICKYKVLISVVDGQEVNDFALKYGVTLVNGDPIAAKWAANQIAIERAVEKTGARRIITFHSRVSTAKEFSSDTSHGIRQYLPDFSVFHVNGSQHSSERKQLLRSFRDADNSLITNARCLTEGIDVPAVDMVAFIDPRHSKIDIAQATGRAMRKPVGSDKEVGYVVIPLFLDRESGETLEKALERSDFADVADVLNAMQEQDDDLVQIIRELQEAKGRGDVFDPSRLAEKIEVLVPSIELSTLRSNIIAEVVERIGVSWDERYGELKHYRDVHGDCNVPRSWKENPQLPMWVSNQRALQSRGQLSADRKACLDAVGFDWSPRQSTWETMLAALKRYRERFNHCDVPVEWVENPDLGQWVQTQRNLKRRGSLSTERKARLDELGFVWNAPEAAWKAMFTELKRYRDKHGDCNVPQGWDENPQLGVWVSSQRAKQNKGILSKENEARLNELGFVWNAREASWETMFAELKRYRDEHGDCKVPKEYRENPALGRWVGSQRKSRQMGKLSAARKERLDEIGFDWHSRDSTWDIRFAELNLYKSEHGDCNVPYGWEQNPQLARWVAKQRARANNGRLSEDRRTRLEKIGMSWELYDSAWERRFSELRLFNERFGHCNVPQGWEENPRLHGWVTEQRALQTRGQLPKERKTRLDELRFTWRDSRIGVGADVQRVEALQGQARSLQRPRDLGEQSQTGSLGDRTARSKETGNHLVRASGATRCHRLHMELRALGTRPA